MLLAGQGTAVAAEKGAAREVKEQLWQQGQVLLAGRGTVAAVVTALPCKVQQNFHFVRTSSSCPHNK